MRHAIKICKHNIIVTDAASIRLTFCKGQGDRFTKVIVNRKSKITLKISLRARIRAFY
jgi:hypothetical protein